MNNQQGAGGSIGGLFRQLPDGRLAFYPHLFRTKGYVVTREMAAALKNWKRSGPVYRMLGLLMLTPSLQLTGAFGAEPPYRPLFFGMLLWATLFPAIISLANGVRIWRIARGLEPAPPRRSNTESFADELQANAHEMTWLSISIFAALCVPLVLPMILLTAPRALLYGNGGSSLFLLFPAMIGLPLMTMLGYMAWVKWRSD
ncbi:MAG TPA: hypothetical protein VMV27_05790 [Candidatus Binataceae bacterium]|nr:hypothetical protein [Candidatus Binataceae bacterium]